MYQRLVLATVLALAAVGLACELEKKFDCNDICDRLQDCLGGIDTSECVSDCESEPADEVDECDECLDDLDNGCIDCTLDCLPLTI